MLASEQPGRSPPQEPWTQGLFVVPGFVDGVGRDVRRRQASSFRTLPSTHPSHQPLNCGLLPRETCSLTRDFIHFICARLHLKFLLCNCHHQQALSLWLSSLYRQGDRPVHSFTASAALSLTHNRHLGNTSLNEWRTLTSWSLVFIYKNEKCVLENNTVEEGLVIKMWEQEKDRGGLFVLPVEAEDRIRGAGAPRRPRQALA